MKHTDSHNRLVDMATIQKNVQFGSSLYDIFVHGSYFDDNEVPHVHIRLKTKRLFRKTEYEVSLVDILTRDEFVSSSFDSYFRSWLHYPYEKRGEYVCNLDAVISIYNNEHSDVSPNYMLEYMKQRGLKVIKKWQSIFTDDDKELFPECF